MTSVKKSSLFLIELIVAILFFAIATTVCVRLFAVSYQMAKESEYRNVALIQAQSIAEQFRSAEGKMERVLAKVEAKNVEDCTYHCYFGNDYQYHETALEESYQMELVHTMEEGISSLRIVITPPLGEKSIYELNTKIYQAKNAEVDGE